MTREEQIDWLCRLRSDISYMDFSIDVQVSLERKKQYRQVLSEVIKALEQEPITKTCKNCRNFSSHHGICEICKDNKCWIEKETIERYHSRNLKAYADEMGVSVEQAEKELLREEPASKNDLRVDWESYKDVDGNSLDDLILEVLQNNFDCGNTYGYKVADEIIELLPSVTPQEPRWIPVSERLPEDTRPVIVTWKNNDPASYYQYIVGKHFIGAAHYLKGKWYWYSSTTEDFLAEYGRYEGEEFDEAIEVIAWQPLPQPYEPQEREG